jgi:pimeloyl-ACP methyl ester carboxylesterase
MQQQGRRTRATDRRYLLGFFVGAYVLAWLAFAVPILAVRGALDLPAPQAVFFALATLGIAVERQARTFQWLTPFGVVRLLIPGALGAELAAYPARAREEITAIDSVGRQWEAFAAEVEALPESMDQVAHPGGFGNLPLVVLSSTRGGAGSTEELQTKLQLDAQIAALSSNSRHVVVDGATHTGLASNPDHARVTTEAILQVAGR